MTALSGQITSQHYKYIECPDLSEGEIAAGAMPAGGTNCKAMGIDLASSFVQGIDQYYLQLYGEYWDPAKQRWDMKGKTQIDFSLIQATGVLTLSKSVSGQLDQDVSLAEAVAGGNATFLELKLWQKALVAAGCAGGAYLGHSLVSEWGPRGKRR